MKHLKLSEILDDPQAAEKIARKDIPPMLAHLNAVQGMLTIKLLESEEKNGDGETGDRLLEVDEACERLGMKKTWLWTHADRLPFAVRIGRKIRFSERGIEEFIKTQKGKGILDER
jgi:excisionase family DNA binding protein